MERLELGGAFPAAVFDDTSVFAAARNDGASIKP
jgi:hypothetical protein